MRLGSEENKYPVPGILFAAPKSGSGKTLITCGFLQALIKRGLRPCSFKCGPDYIDPMFHRYVLRIPGANLDSFFLDEEGVERSFNRTIVRNRSDIAVIEGVMGYYDGVGGIHTQASAYDISRITRTPVILILDGKGASLSLAATVKGFADFRPDSRIEGVILNRTSPAVAAKLEKQIEAETGIPVVGSLPEAPEYSFESRHLGLFLPGEIDSLCRRLKRLAEQMEKTVDIGRILAIAGAGDINRAKSRDGKSGESRDGKGGESGAGKSGESGAGQLSGNAKCIKCEDMQSAVRENVRIAVARDEAFCFYYQENLDLLEEQGAELVHFSPLHDKELPEDVAGILLGGGYPENYAAELSKNKEMLRSIRKAWQQEIPMLAECGGFLYLHDRLEGSDGIGYPMAGIYKMRAFRTGKLGRFGYVSLTLPDGASIKGHEFHYWESEEPGEDWLAEKPASERKWRCIHQDGARICGFPHLYYLSAPSFTEWWLKQCRAWSREKTGKGYK